EPQPRMDRLQPERLARGCEDVAVAGGVHDRLSQEGLAPRLALCDESPNRALGDDRPRDPRVQAQSDAGLGEQFVRREAELLRVVGYGVADGMRPPAPNEPEPAGRPGE